MKTLLLFLWCATAMAYDPNGSVTEESYEGWIDRAQEMFAPYVQKLGYRLDIQKHWSSTETGCYTSFERPPVFKIVLNGAAFRNKETTNDGVAYTLCHELSHIIGGRPKYVNDEFWGSAEGQADYMATNICLKNLFSPDDNLALLDGLNVPASVRSSCDTAYPSSSDSALCQRSILAGLSFAQNNRRYKIESYTRPRNTPAFKTIAAPLSLTRRDPTIVKELNRSYSIPQCRLDSAIAGALCHRGVSFHLDRVNDPNTFNCQGADPADTHRPKCWFK